MIKLTLLKGFLPSFQLFKFSKCLTPCRLDYCSSIQTRRFSSDDNLGKLAYVNDEHHWVRSTLPEIQTVQDKTIHEEIWDRALEWGDATAYECFITGQKYSHREVRMYSQGFAGSLIQAGISNNATIGLVLPNSPEYPIALLGAWGAGCLVSPVNPAYTPHEIMRQLEISKASSVITTERFLETILTAKNSCGHIKNIIIIGKSPEGCLPFFEMIKTSPQGFHFLKGSEINMKEHVPLLPFSSGTTGLPKGVMLTHSNLATHLKQVLQDEVAILNPMQEGYQERWIGLLPFFHMYGCLTVLMNSMHGGHMLTLPGFEPKMFSNALKKLQPTTLSLVTPLLNFMIQSPDVTSEELRHIEHVVIGAAPIGAGLMNRFVEKAKKDIQFQEAWGMTEATAVATLVQKHKKNSKIGSCGTPASSTVVKVVDTVSGKTVGPNQKGELYVKGPQVMKGYFNNEKANKETFDSDGWLRTGDIGYYDDSKHFYIVDRLKELIKVKGFQVAPSELEYLLRDHEDVGDVAVIGVPNEEWGELPRAYIVLKAGKRADQESINSFLADKVATFKQLRGGIEFIDAIPKAPSGKILRRELLASYKEKY